MADYAGMTDTTPQTGTSDPIALSLEQLEAATVARQLLADEYAAAHPDWNKVGALKAAVRACHEAANVYALLSIATRPHIVLSIPAGAREFLPEDAALGLDLAEAVTEACRL